MRQQKQTCSETRVFPAGSTQGSKEEGSLPVTLGNFANSFVYQVFHLYFYFKWSKRFGLLLSAHFVCFLFLFLVVCGDCTAKGNVRAALATHSLRKTRTEPGEKEVHVGALNYRCLFRTCVSGALLKPTFYWVRG